LTVNEIPGFSAEQVEEVAPEQAGKRQVRLGVFVIAGLIATVYLLYLLTDPATFRNRYKVTTTVDNVMGLRKGDPVQMRGVNIGQVNDFELGATGEDVVIILEIEGQWIIPEGSTTQLVTPGLMAPRTVEVLPGPGPGTIGRGDAMPGIAVKGLLDDTESLGEKGQEVLDRITELLSPENVDAFGGSAEGLRTLVGDLSDVVTSEGDNLKGLIESLRQAADGLAAVTADAPELREDLASTMASADSLMVRLNATSESIEGVVGSLETILTRMENGEGTLGRLSVNDSLFTSLLAAAESARLLMDDVRENPSRYINVSIF
jgi:phospholipid/cholesterol/gamma-HCH transport system substrate-binding protein